LGHSTTYYPQGNGLEESSNKILMRIIKKILTKNKKVWHIHLKYALWENKIGTKRSIGMSHFQLFYGTNVILPINISLPVMKLWQDANEEPNDLTRRINQIIEVQQNKGEVNEKIQKCQDNMKFIFDKKSKDNEFLLRDLVMKWEARKEDTRKHGKFDHLWFGPFKIAAIKGRNSFSLENLNGEILEAPINGRYLKHFMQ
jgi:hypothetical protein